MDIHGYLWISIDIHGYPLAMFQVWDALPHPGIPKSQLAGYIHDRSHAPQDGGIVFIYVCLPPLLLDGFAMW